MVEKRSMLKQHNMRSCRLPHASFLHNKFFTPISTALFDIQKQYARINVHHTKKGLAATYNKSLNQTCANKAAHAG